MNPFEMTTKRTNLVVTIENSSNVTRGLTVQFKATGTVYNPSLFEVKRQKGFKILCEMHAGDVLTVTTGLKNKRVKLKQNGVEKAQIICGCTAPHGCKRNPVTTYSAMTREAASAIWRLLFPVRPPIGVYSLWNYMCLPKAVNFWA